MYRTYQLKITTLIPRCQLRSARSTSSTSGSRNFDWNSDEYQFLEKSTLPSLHFQKSLPRLPIPKLEKTCERYLAAQVPISSGGEYAETVKLVGDFKNGEGARLDERLRAIDKSNKHTSYISKTWFDMYLKDRVPLPLNYNPAMVFVDGPAHLNSQLIRATNLVVSSLRFMKSLRAEVLSPEVYHMNAAKSDTPFFRKVVKMMPARLATPAAYVFKAFPLDMSQYSSLFNSTRIPKLGGDILVKDETKRHLLVLRKGNFYKFNVLDEIGAVLPASEIRANLEHILSQSTPTNQQSLALLTTGNRDDWAKAREHLESISATNAASLKDIDSAIFVLCLDDENLAKDPQATMRSILHGNGLNRWFDKSFSLIVSSDGTSGLNFEHSWGDGVAVLRYIQEILKDTQKNIFVRPDDDKTNAKINVKLLEFNVDERINCDLENAKKEHQKRIDSMAVNVMQLETFGKRNCKAAKLSPDSVMQLAFQVAYHKVYDTFVGTYESCSTAAFLHGRTETMRPNTIHTRDFALAFNGQKQPSSAELIQMMQKCSQLHGQLTKEAAMGQGFDRHLFALRNLAAQDGNIPSIFTHPSYVKMNHNILSTSTLSAEVVSNGGFGPVVADGLGVGYNVLNDKCGAMVTSYPAKRDGAQFVGALQDTLLKFSALLSQK